MRKKLIFILIQTILLLVGVSCQQMPTSISQQSDVQPQVPSAPNHAQALTWAEHILKARPVFLDTRNALDFGVSHIPGALNIHWEDFAKTSEGQKGELQSDEFSIARRLALWGITPETPVVVVGQGLRGNGEEGRVAWMLKYLGVQDVSLSQHQLFRSAIAREEMLPENKPTWIPIVNDSLVVTLDDFKKALNLSKDKNLSKIATVVLDVRTTEELKKENQLQEQLQDSFVHVPWTQFYTAEGLVNPQVQNILEKQNIHSNNRIIVISQHGVRSAAAVFALSSLGWKNVGNFAGGYEEWQWSKRTGDVKSQSPKKTPSKTRK